MHRYHEFNNCNLRHGVARYSLSFSQAILITGNQLVLQIQTILCGLAAVWQFDLSNIVFVCDVFQFQLYAFNRLTIFIDLIDTVVDRIVSHCCNVISLAISINGTIFSPVVAIRYTDFDNCVLLASFEVLNHMSCFIAIQVNVTILICSIRTDDNCLIGVLSILIRSRCFFCLSSLSQFLGFASLFLDFISRQIRILAVILSISCCLNQCINCYL